MQDEEDFLRLVCKFKHTHTHMTAALAVLPFNPYHRVQFCEIFERVMRGKKEESDDDGSESEERWLDDDNEDVKSEESSTSQPVWKTKTATEFFKEAIMVDNKHLIEWLIAVGSPVHHSVIDFCVTQNKISFAKLLVKSTVGDVIKQKSKRFYASVASIGDLELLKSFDCELHSILADFKVIKRGHFEIFKWFYESDLLSEYNFDDFLDVACRYGHLHFVKYILEDMEPHPKINKSKTSPCAQAAKGGHLEILQFLREHKFKWDHNTMWDACENGHIDIVKYVIENKCPWTSSSLESAIRKNNFEIVEFLTEHVREKKEFKLATLIAATNGHLEMLKYLHEHGFPSDESLCDASSEHLDCLIYVHEVIKVEWSKDTCLSCLAENNLSCLKYAIENGCPYKHHLQKLKRYAREDDHHEILEYLNTL